MIKIIQVIISGIRCPKCGGNKIYTLGDSRKKCGSCFHRYSIKKYELEFKILHYFCLEISARKAAKDLQISYKNVSSRFQQFRAEIAGYLESSLSDFTGEIECDESYFGGKRKGPRREVAGGLHRGGEPYPGHVRHL